MILVVTVNAGVFFTKFISNFNSNKFDISLVCHAIILYYLDLFTYRHLVYH